MNLTEGATVTVTRNDGGNKKGRLFKYQAELLGWKKDKNGSLLLRVKTANMGQNIIKYVQAKNVLIGDTASAGFINVEIIIWGWLAVLAGYLFIDWLGN